MGRRSTRRSLVSPTGQAKFSIPGLETVDKKGVHHATKLGELLSGTVLGTKVPSEKEVQEQLAEVNKRQAEALQKARDEKNLADGTAATGANTVATDANTQALRGLTDAAMEMF